MVEAASLIFYALGAGIALVIIALVLYYLEKNKKPLEDIKKVTQTDKLLFEIKPAEIPALPELKVAAALNVRYPLIPPYCYANIKWDASARELVYTIEEPTLTSEEQRILKTLEAGIEELVNLSFISSKDKYTVMSYLEKNIKVLLTELSIKLSMDSFLKIMYYVYRDFVGLNELEPLMNDYFIEDIECNGLNTPVYVVHRKYRNIRTNLVYRDLTTMTTFVEKIAQKCGRYVSYAEPLLDGTLPDGSRINATYTTDVSSRGPTFSIRKFTKEPWNPLQLVQKGTSSFEILAYAWMCMEYEHSFMVVGGTGSGKCVTGDTPVYLSNGQVLSIKKLVEEKFVSGKILRDDGWEIVDGDGTELLSMDPTTLKIGKKKISKLWRHKAPDHLVKIKTRSGREITTTPEHPFFTMKNGEVIKIRADCINKHTPIAVPKKLDVEIEREKVNLLDYISDERDLYVYQMKEDVKDIISKIIKLKGITEKKLAEELKIKSRMFGCWKNQNAIPLSVYKKLSEMSQTKLEGDIVLKAKTSKSAIHIPILSKELFRFVALVIGDGHLTIGKIQLHNSNKELREEFLKLGKELFGVEGYERYPKERVPLAEIGSVVVARILHSAFEIPYGNKARGVIVPRLIYQQDNECISEFISGIVDCEGYIGKNNLEISSTSKELSNGVCRLMLRLGITPSKVDRTDHYRIYVSGRENIEILYNNVKLRIDYKRENLSRMFCRELKTTTPNLDVIPSMTNKIKMIRDSLHLSQAEFAGGGNTSRRLIGMWENGLRNPSRQTLGQLNEFLNCGWPDENFMGPLHDSDILWDNIVDIKIVEKHGEKYVYDLTVEGTHNFVAGDIPIITHNTSLLNALAFFIPPQARIVSIEDTRELQLSHENWLPSVSRAGVGLSNMVGQKYGEVSLFDLLKASFRQRPDYIIVGEIRGKEAYVLFQAFSSGHPGCATMHAESVDTMIRRLETPPINLSGSMLMTLSAVFTIEQTKVRGKDVRKVTSVDEIIDVQEHLKGFKINNVFRWDPRVEAFRFNPNSVVFDKIATHYGFKKEDLVREYQARVALLKTLYNRGIVGFKEVQEVIHEYYKAPQVVMRKYGLIK